MQQARLGALACVNRALRSHGRVHGTRHSFQAWLSSALPVPSGPRGMLLSSRTCPSWCKIANRQLSWSFEDDDSAIGETWRRVKKPKKKKSSALARDRQNSVAQARLSKDDEVDRSVRNASHSRDRPEMNEAPERPVLKKTAPSGAQFRYLPPFKKPKPVYKIGRPKPAPRACAPKPELGGSKKSLKTAFKASKAHRRKPT